MSLTRWFFSLAMGAWLALPIMANPPSWAAKEGQSLEIEGTAANAKLGAILLAPEGTLWIDGLPAWPENLVHRQVRVRGRLIARRDLPVFVPKPGEPIPQGIPVEDASLLPEASRRFLLASATWLVFPPAPAKGEPQNSDLVSADTILSRIRNRLPAGWSMHLTTDSLVLERQGPVRVFLDNRINVPSDLFATGTPSDGVPPSLEGVTRIRFRIEPRLERGTLARRETANAALWRRIQGLPREFRLEHLFPEEFGKPGPAHPTATNASEARRLANLEAEKQQLLRELQPMPDGQSEWYSLFRQEVEGIEDDLHRIDPPAASQEAYQLLQAIEEILEPNSPPAPPELPPGR